MIDRVADWRYNIIDFLNQYDSMEEIEEYLLGHDLTLDLITVWAFAVGFGILALVEITTWAVMWGTSDQTAVGKWLRPKKVGYFVICAAMSTLYSLTLMAYYKEMQFSIWDRLGIRFFGILGIFLSVTFGLCFIIALTRERWFNKPSKKGDSTSVSAAN